MDFADSITELERRFWLEGPDFYAAHLASDCVMVFPEPAGVLDGRAAIDAAAGPRWSSVRIDRDRILEPREQVALLVYQAEARRPGAPVYRVRASSLYVTQDSAWRLAFHQQTPADDGSPTA